MFSRSLLPRDVQNDVALPGRALLGRVKVGYQVFSLKGRARLSTVEGEQWNPDLSFRKCGGGRPYSRRNLLAVPGSVRVACRILDPTDEELAWLIRLHLGPDEVCPPYHSRGSARIPPRRSVRGDPDVQGSVDHWPGSRASV